VDLNKFLAARLTVKREREPELRIPVIEKERPMQTEKTAIIPVLVKKPTPVEESIQELSNLLIKPNPDLIEGLSALAIDGGVALLPHEVKALPIFRTHLTSGFNYAAETKMLAYVRFGVTTSNYIVLQSLILDGISSWVSHYYTIDGKYAFSEGPITHTFAEHGNKLMEANCPILNHIYNILSQEYAKTSEGKTNTRLVHTLEQVLRRVHRIRAQELSISKGIHDPAIRSVNDQLMEVELDPVYTWKERRNLFASLKEERSELIRTKKRAHKKSFRRYTLPLLVYDAKAAFIRFQRRPWSNFLGFLETLFIDPIRWFIGVVKSNMGYSVALAIYSPFTFFFITQPMNPHAMWAVGKVRNAYIESVDAVRNVFTTQNAAGTAVVAAIPSGSAKNYSELKPAIPGMLLSSDAPDVATQSWDERMSNFKAMQISYEENMEIAPRLGRLEQMETQLNWPLIVESAWLETERYLSFLNFVEFNQNDYTPEFVNFIRAEKARVDQVQLYLWDRNVRFILDHPFTMMDQSGEQTQMDYYVGRSFLMLRDMTNNLAMKHKGLPLPAGFDSIMKLAQMFEADYKSGGSVLDRLKNNSKLFQQKNSLDTAELRSYMKRQWEVLYLLQNHAQEASNFGLQVYIWSVRNTVYTLQSLYSTKREELSMIALNFKKGAIVNKLTNNLAFKQMDSQYEALYHMMVLEYASVRKEIGESLKKDIDSVQRRKIIEGVEAFLKERDTLLKNANLI